VDEEEISIPDYPPGARSAHMGYRRVLRSLGAIQKLRLIEDELREQASGSQDGYLLDVANRMREALRQFR
jgi:hypothetical protein